MGRVASPRANGGERLGRGEPTDQADGQQAARTTPTKLAELVATALSRQTGAETHEMRNEIR